MPTQAQYATTMSGDESLGSWGGLVSFAAIVMILIGAFQATAGLVGIVNDEFYLATEEYVFQFDATTWGWVHLLLGTVIFLAGFGVVLGQVWARSVGVVLASFSALAMFMFIPYYPLWSVLIIALDVMVIWALAVHATPTASQ